MRLDPWNLLQIILAKESHSVFFPEGLSAGCIHIFCLALKKSLRINFNLYI